MAKYTSNYSGLEIDQGIGKAFADVGDAYFDSTTNQQYLFKSTDDKMAWLSGDTSIEYKVCAFEFSGTINKMTVVNYMDSKNLYYTQMSESAVITVGFKSEEKGITDTSWNEVIEDARITVEIDRGVTGKYDTIVSEQLVLNGNTLSVDIFKYLATGNSRVRVTATGVDTGSTANIVYSVLLTSMYLAPANFKWNVPFIEGQAYQLGGLYIGGALDKILKIKVSNEQTYLKNYEVNMGTQTHTSIAYYYPNLEFPTEGTGIYTVEMWLDANGLESEHLSYNIMCIGAEEVNTAQLIAVSNVLPTAKNFATNKLYSYAVYNGGATTASPMVNVSAIINNTPTNIVKNEVLDNVATGVINDYIVDLEIDTQETNVQLYSSIELGECKQEAVYQIDNSASFPAVGGAMFYLNPANRSNTQANRTTIVNESNLAGATREYSATWENVSFTDGMDGWTTDNEGRKCLRLPAGSKLNVDFAPFANARTRTVEISYRVENTANFNEDIISIATDLTQQFVGARVKPTNVLLHSSLLRTDDLLQGYNTKDEELVHLLITVIQNYKQIGNLAQIYVNGVKKCSFEWSTSDTFANNGNLVFGSNTADLYVYKTRVYTEAFDWIMAAQNFISCLPDTTSKKAAHAKMVSVLNDGNKIDFDQVKNNGYNYFVLRLPSGANLPSILSQSAVENCRLEINIQQNPSFAVNGVFEDETTEGQGTTAMNYFRWNLRWKTDTIRITAKKNFASSMHSHKMGATALFNDLNRMIVGANEADARVAVEQYGCYGFLEILKEGSTDQYTYIPIGLYTIGQDKGDKATFGYNNKTYKSTLIHLEGTDHSPKAVGMDYPWDKLSVATNSDGDANLGVKQADGTVIAAWEIGACGSAESDAEMYEYLTQEFYPAYDCDYRNTPMLVGLEKGTTIADVNNNLSVFRATETDLGYTNADCLIWIDGEYDTYYYDVLQNKYIKDGINILTDLGITASDLVGTNASEKTKEIRELRKARYRATMENFWDLRDSLFSESFLTLHCGTDNEKKNTYPYKFGTLKSGSRWRWRQDDLDTLFDINNQGLANKPYSLLNGDKAGTTHYFRGNSSYHWTNIRQYYPNELKAMMLEILTAMASLSDTGGSLIERAVGCIRKYFWNKAQDYFTKSAYNLDAEWSYEEAWAAMKNGTYQAPVHPLQQSLGDHYEAERAFVEKRFIFMASLYGFGAFGVGNDSDVSLGQISFRPAQGDNTFNLTPAIDLNPTILVGDSDRKSADGRLLAGETAEITVSTDGDTSIYIQGADYLSDIGDFANINLYAENPQLTVQSKRLQKLKVGDENASEVTTVLKTLNVLSCPSLSEVDARNVSTLTGTVDLSNCPRLTKALFGGSGAGEIMLPTGSKITEFELPDGLINLSLVNLPNLDNDGLKYGELNALTYLRLENNAHIQGFAMLKATYEAGSPLTNIRVIGFDYDGTADDVTLLATLANGGYFGINADGSPNNEIIPVIEGTINVDGSIYEDDANIIFEKYGRNLILNVTGGYYVKFADPEVQRICAENWGDGTGITTEQIEAVTDIGTKFANNTLIETFDEFGKFKNATILKNKNFQGCTNLKSIDLSEITELIGGSIFSDVPLEGELNMPKLVNIQASGVFDGQFRNNKFTKIIKLGQIPSLPNGYNTTTLGTFGKSSLLEEVVLPETLETIGKYSFYDCSNLRKVNIDKLPNLRVIGMNAFVGCDLSETSLISDSIEEIGANAFRNAANLSGTVSLPKLKRFETTSAKDSTIFGGTKIVEVADLGEITTIYNGYNSNYGAFNGCGFLTKVNLPNTLTQIGQYSFRHCTALSSINFHTAITIIGQEAFYNCTSLEIEDLQLPNLETLGQNAFYGVKIKKIGDLGKLTALPSATTSIQNFGDKSVLEEVVLPEGITEIPANSFYYYTNLSDMEIPDSVLKLGDNVFSGCKSMTKIVANGVTSVGSSFIRDTNIKQVILPSIVSLGGSVFTLCYNLELVDLGENLTSIGTYCFWQMTGNLTTFICRATTPPSLASNNNLSFCKVIYVPDASVEAYKTASGWSAYADRIKPLSEYVES